MLGGRVKAGDGKVDLQCPQCGARFQATEAEAAAAKGKVRCPNGHEFGVMGALAGGGGGAAGGDPM